MHKLTNHAFEILAVIALLDGLVALFVIAAGRKKTPKPGRDYDERGTYGCGDSVCESRGRCVGHRPNGSI